MRRDTVAALVLAGVGAGAVALAMRGSSGDDIVAAQASAWWFGVPDQDMCQPGQQYLGNGICGRAAAQMARTPDGFCPQGSLLGSDGYCHRTGGMAAPYTYSPWPKDVQPMPTPRTFGHGLQSPVPAI